MALWSGITHLSNAISRARVDRSRSEASSRMTNKMLHTSVYVGLVRYPQVPGCCGHPHPALRTPRRPFTAAYARQLPFAVVLQALLYTDHQDRRSSCHGRRSAVLRPSVNSDPRTMLLCEDLRVFWLAHRGAQTHGSVFESRPGVASKGRLVARKSSAQCVRA